MGRFYPVPALVERMGLLYPLPAVTAFLVVFSAFSALILAVHVALSVGLIVNLAGEHARRRRPRPAPSGARAEVVVAVRNEQETLPRLLESLRAQTESNVLFLFVDDRSQDGTARLLEEFRRTVGDRARVIRIEREPQGLTGKQAALDLAFDCARGDVLLFTDGDCVVPPTWAEEMVNHFDDPRVGVVLGRIELPEAPGFLGRFQSFEQPLLNQYNFGSVGIRLPTGCFGNNMAIRARAVREIGGFRSLGYSVTEDAMLLDAVCRKGGWQVRACVSGRAACQTRAQVSWRAYLEQHTRWNAGALFSPDLVTSLSYVLVVLIYLVGSLLVLPLGLLDWRVPVLSLNSFLSIGLLAALGGMYEGRHRGRYYLRLFPYLFFFGFFYSFVTVRAVLRRPFDWKGSKLVP
jgi:cellulose synthase/poly-beta-1,6-N-acetylglucosamine synthase-like glycosyltransferase